MQIHHLDCVSMCPPGRRLMDGRRGESGPATLTCHCVAIELGSRLVLVDTGFGLRDVAEPEQRLSDLFLKVLCRPDLREEDTAVRQLARRGLAAEDVTDIVLTHLDFDHAGGLDDFPNARVHLLEAERAAAAAPETALDRMRFRPQQWSSSARWTTYAARGERWNGFEAVRDLDGLPSEILIVPLPGHTKGHAGVAVDTGQGWLFHAGDAYFYHEEMSFDRPRCPPGLRFYQTFMEKNRRLRLDNQARLRELAQRHGDDVTVFCAHDPTEFERLAGISRARAAPAPKARTAHRDVQRA